MSDDFKYKQMIEDDIDKTKISSNNDISDNALDALQDTLDVQNQPTLEDIEEKLGNTLTNGLSMDFLDEPVLQKVKTR